MNDPKYLPMKPDVKKAWVKALRTGGYQQTTGYLWGVDEVTATDSFCCLGVLTNLRQPKVDVDLFVDTIGCPLPMPRTEVMVWAGLRCDEATDHLTSMNDTYGNSFDEIADWIEVNL